MDPVVRAWAVLAVARDGDEYVRACRGLGRFGSGEISAALDALVQPDDLSRLRAVADCLRILLAKKEEADGLRAEFARLMLAVAQRRSADLHDPPPAFSAYIRDPEKGAADGKRAFEIFYDDHFPVPIIPTVLELAMRPSPVLDCVLREIVLKSSSPLEAAVPEDLRAEIARLPGLAWGLALRFLCRRKEALALDIAQAALLHQSRARLDRWFSAVALGDSAESRIAPLLIETGISIGETDLKLARTCFRAAVKCDARRTGAEFYALEAVVESDPDIGTMLGVSLLGEFSGEWTPDLRAKWPPELK